jgi:hypothetical protein
MEVQEKRQARGQPQATPLGPQIYEPMVELYIVRHQPIKTCLTPLQL